MQQVQRTVYEIHLIIASCLLFLILQSKKYSYGSRDLQIYVVSFSSGVLCEPKRNK